MQFETPLFCFLPDWTSVLTNILTMNVLVILFGLSCIFFGLNSFKISRKFELQAANVSHLIDAVVNIIELVTDVQVNTVTFMNHDESNSEVKDIFNEILLRSSLSLKASFRVDSTSFRRSIQHRKK